MSRIKLADANAALEKLVFEALMLRPSSVGDGQAFAAGVEALNSVLKAQIVWHIESRAVVKAILGGTQKK